MVVNIPFNRTNRKKLFFILLTKQKIPPKNNLNKDERIHRP